MRRLVACALAMIGCHGGSGAAPDAASGDAAPADADTRDILVRLQALPGVSVHEQTPRFAPPGYRYFLLEVTQPVDHDHPGATFAQEVSLIHRDVTAPMIALTSGYEDFYGDYAAELTQLLHANQISIEHRYFGTSRPAPADLDWTKLTIAQMAADEHHVVELLKPIYGAAWLDTGASKGGMTATYHRRFYPDDVAGTVAYVAPLSHAIPDARYVPQFDTVGGDAGASCRAAVKAVALELIQHRRAAMLQRAQDQATAQGYTYTRIAIGPALESAIQDLEWSYWQYSGLASCGSVPVAATATDDELWAFLEQIGGVSFSDDTNTASFEAYFYQAYAQLGSPGTAAVRGDSAPAALAPYLMYGEHDFDGTLPQGTPIPTYDPAPMSDIASWIGQHGSHLIFVYGQWDPWTGGAYPLGGAQDAMEATVADGTHGASLVDLAPADRDAAFAKLAAWTGVTPVIPANAHREAPEASRRRRHPM